MHNIQISELSEDKLLLHLSLGRITFLSFQEKVFLYNNLDSSNTLAIHSIEDIEKKLNKTITTRVIWDGKENLRLAKVALGYCKTLGIQILVHSDKAYPENLRQISDPPYLLFCRGDISLLAKKNVSVVGTRRVTPGGRKACKDFAYEAVLDGRNVVSGLANGVDSCAHQGAINALFDCQDKGLDLAAYGKTIAVLPSAIDEILPLGNKKLAEQILETGGLIVSEYEPKLQMAVWHYVGRNRIIAGLSEATVVIEAPSGSGALITADFALDYNREVMFHQAAFGELAKSVASAVHSRLEVEHAAGKVSKYKIENTPEKFLEAGAPVIKDYNDFCEVLALPPGQQKLPLQGDLF